jgi:hypothetical protein
MEALASPFRYEVWYRNKASGSGGHLDYALFAGRKLDRLDREGCRAQPYDMLIRDIARCSIVLVGKHRTDGQPRKHD